MKHYVIGIMFLLLNVPLATAEDSKPTTVSKPATIQTGIHVPAGIVIDIGEGGIVHPRQLGVIAKDRDGNVWESRKMTDAVDSKNAFYRKAAGNPVSDSRQPSFDKPPANWPKLAGDLNGNMEVRIKNPNDFKVRVGLRSAGRGKDFVVAANATESVRVANGRYDIYFHYSTDPDGLYQGDSFTLSGNGVEIQMVQIVNGNYGIRKVK